MKLKIKNVCTIKDADLDFNGITVLAGENNTGKSTISKTLFSSFFALKNYKIEINNVIINSIINKLRPFNFDLLDYDNQNTLLKKILDLRQSENKNEMVLGVLESIIYDYLQISDKRSDYLDYKIAINEIKSILEKNNNYYTNDFFTKCFNDEFRNQIFNVSNSDDVSQVELLFNSNKEINKIIFKNNMVIQSDINTNIVHNILYIDGQDIDYYLPLNNNVRDYYYHKYVMDSDVVFDNKNNLIFDEILQKDLCEYFNDFGNLGDVYVEKGETYYVNSNYKTPISPLQMSQGLKSIIILRQLYIKKKILDKTFVVLDEPEINLHPKWQVFFAKLICKLNLKKKIHFLISSHSPYFISAINEYSKFYNINDKCKYYYAKEGNDGIYNNIEDYSNEPKKIFSALYEPIITLREVNDNNV